MINAIVYYTNCRIRKLRFYNSQLDLHIIIEITMYDMANEVNIGLTFIELCFFV